MHQPLSYRHRVITDEDIVFISQLIADHPESSRRNLSERLCEAWNWVQANGALRSMVCRGLMLMLHRQGLIELPPVRRVMRNPFLERGAPVAVTVDEAPLGMALAVSAGRNPLPSDGEVAVLSLLAGTAWLDRY